MSVAVAELTTDQVLIRLRELGRPITRGTWTGMVVRREAPPPVRHVGRTPLYDTADVELFGRYQWKAQR